MLESVGWKVTFLMVLTVSKMSCASSEIRAIFAVVSSIDWETKNDIAPKFQEDVSVQDFNSGGGSSRRKKLEFRAMNKTWTVDAQLYSHFTSDDTSFDFRDLQGRVISTTAAPKDCFYVGKVDAGPTEAGYATISTCYNKFHVAMLTNLNDYMLNPPIPKYRPRQYKRHFESSFEHTFHNSRPRRSTPDVPDTWDVRIGPLPQVKGRKGNLGVTLILDETFITDYRDAFEDASQQELYNYIINTFAFMQLWYINPTFGFQVWLSIHKIIFVEDRWSIYLEDGSKYGLLASCNWQKKVFSDSSEWDVVAFISVQEGVWGGIGGLAFPATACRREETNCLGVHHQGLQVDLLARALSHELAHTLGAQDDYNRPTSGYCKAGMMTSGLYEDRQWSYCSIQRIERWMRAEGSECLHVGPSGDFITPTIPVNVAWRAKAEQSSTYQGQQAWGAWKATDGSLQSLPFDEWNPTIGSCSSTLTQRDPWLLITLDDSYKNSDIDAVHVYNRIDCCADRLHDFEVRIGNDRNFQNNPLCNKHPGAVRGGKNGMANIHCERSLSGKYVSIQIKGEKETLAVCEVNVMQAIDFATIDSHECRDEIGYCTNIRYNNRCQHSSGSCRLTCGECSMDFPTWAEDANERGTQPSQPSCSDESRECWHIVANNRCKNEKYVERCNLSCFGCGKYTTTTTPTTTTPRTTTQPPCEDHDPNCPAWGSIGHCDLNPSLKTTCRKTCTDCDGVPKPESTPRPCFDVTVDCSWFVANGQCLTSSSILNNCRKSCDNCDGSKCVDRNSACSGWAGAGNCNNNPQVQSECMRSCGQCQ